MKPQIKPEQATGPPPPKNQDCSVVPYSGLFSDILRFLSTTIPPKTDLDQQYKPAAGKPQGTGQSSPATKADDSLAGSQDVTLMGCGSSKATEGTPQPPPIPLQTAPETVRPVPSRGGERPRPPSRAQHERPSSSSHGRRPPGSSHGESSKRPGSAAGSRRRPSRPSSSSGRERPSSSHPRRFDAILEHVQYPEDSTILRTASSLKTHIKQHALNFYIFVHVDLGGCRPAMRELEDPTTRCVGIRQYVARGIIGGVIMAKGESSPEFVAATSTDLANDLFLYAIPSLNGEREGQLRELCKLGARLRKLISSHPSIWGFGAWDAAPGYITVFPAVLKDEGQVVGEERAMV